MSTLMASEYDFLRGQQQYWTRTAQGKLVTVSNAVNRALLMCTMQWIDAGSTFLLR